MVQQDAYATLTDFYETISPFSLFDSWSAVSDIHYRGSSFEVDLLSVYLNMNQEQKNEYVQLLKKVQKIEFDLNGDDYLSRRAKTPQEGLSIRNEMDKLERTKANLLPSELKKILGDEKYNSYLDLCLWKKYYYLSGGNDKNMQQNDEWKRIDALNNQALKDAGLEDENLQSNYLKALYQQNLDFVESVKEKGRLSGLHKGNKSNLSIIIQGFKARREERRGKLSSLPKTKIQISKRLKNLLLTEEENQKK